VFEVGYDLLALLIVTGFIAGFVDAIAGGGGLITLPVLLLAGSAPVEALATNKVQGIFGSGTAAYSYAKKGLVDLRTQWKPALLSFAASFVGAILITFLPVGWIQVVLPFLLIAVALFFAFKPGLDDVDRVARIGPVAFAFIVVPLIGGYDGLLGPGTGSFFMIAFVMLAGYGVLRATAYTKLLNFASNVGGLIAFSVVATPWWFTGLAMGLAQMAGAMFGARVAMRGGAKVIKPLLVITSTALAIKLLLAWF